MQQQQFGFVAGVDTAQAGTGVGYDLTQSGFGLERHASIVEPSRCSAAAGTAEHRLLLEQPSIGSALQIHLRAWLDATKKLESVQVSPEGIRRGYQPSSHIPGDFPCHTSSYRIGAARFSAYSWQFDRLHLSNRCNQWIVLIASEWVT
ncbi:unnamed protein product [Stenotrophomonas maltophilia]|nr:unnamed protein product [Stenotrophomonas maltophilia]